MKKTCLNCKHFRPEDVYTGRCRIEKHSLLPEKYPIMKHDDVCDRWKDAGQQYYIRIGWLKAQELKNSENRND